MIVEMEVLREIGRIRAPVADVWDILATDHAVGEARGDVSYKPAHTMNIELDNPAYFADFIRLNEAWIGEHFEIEASDRSLANDPGSILRGGGHILVGLVQGQAAGCAALFRVGARHFELARMAVAAKLRGRGYGRALALAALQQAKAAGGTKVTLLSNTKLRPAIALYRTLGFVAVREGPHPEYARCNLVMEREL